MLQTLAKTKSSKAGLAAFYTDCLLALSVFVGTVVFIFLAFKRQRADSAMYIGSATAFALLFVGLMLSNGLIASKN